MPGFQSVRRLEGMRPPEPPPEEVTTTAAVALLAVSATLVATTWNVPADVGAV